MTLIIHPRLPLPMIHALPLALTVLLIPVLASAHVGDAGGTPFGTGLGHPVGGADHVLAMVAVGLWAAITRGRALWAMPLSFVGAMIAGGVAGGAGVTFPYMEPMILASIVLLGVAAALALRVPLLASLAGIAVFGVVHGVAHGAEGPGGFAYAAGFVLSTAALHGVGIALGLGLRSNAARALGGGAALAGLGLAFA